MIEISGRVCMVFFICFLKNILMIMFVMIGNNIVCKIEIIKDSGEIGSYFLVNSIIKIGVKIGVNKVEIVVIVIERVVFFFVKNVMILEVVLSG